MADTQTTARPAAEPMQTGGQVMAIVPQTFPEIQRVAVTIINAGVAPASLIKYAKADDTPEEIEAIGKRNVAAVSTCIMAGAELGLPPMVSLRAFTVINGKPALYADGNVAVVRKAKTPEGQRVAEYIRTGYTEVRDCICPVCKKTFPDDEVETHFILDHDEAFAKLISAGRQVTLKMFGRTEPTDASHAWCEGKRADSGEIYRETFSIADAKRAGLWEGDKPFKRAKVWRNNVQGWHDDVPNDAPWFRYWKRMMMWRAVGYCLRWLFADVLGGMADEYEAREIEGMVDVTPAAPRQITRPTPPKPPEEDPEPPKGGKVIDQAETSTAEANVNQQPESKQASDDAAFEAGRQQAAEDDFNDDDSGVTVASGDVLKDPLDLTPGSMNHTIDITTGQLAKPVEFVPTGTIGPKEREALDTLTAELASAETEAQIEERFDLADVQTEFAGNDLAIAEAFKIKDKAISDLATKQHADLEEQGQTSLFASSAPPKPPVE